MIIPVLGSYEKDVLDLITQRAHVIAYERFIAHGGTEIAWNTCQAHWRLSRVVDELGEAARELGYS